MQLQLLKLEMVKTCSPLIILCSGIGNSKTISTINNIMYDIFVEIYIKEIVQYYKIYSRLEDIELNNRKQYFSQQ